MNRCQIEWAKKQQDLIDSLDEDIHKFDHSDGWNLSNESPEAVVLETKTPQPVNVSLIWKLRHLYDPEYRTIKLQNQFLTTEIFKKLQDFYIEERDRQQDLLTKVQTKDFNKDNCKCDCGAKACWECEDFQFRKTVEEAILARPYPT